MTVGRTAMNFSWRIYGLGIMALGVACLVFRDFDPGQPVPLTFPFRITLVYAAGTLMVVAAAAVEWRRTTAWGAAILTAYYAICVLLLMNGRVLLTGFAAYGTYEEISMQVALTVGGLVVFVQAAQIDARIDGRLTARLKRIGQLAFGVCALIWGGAHFIYMNLTAPLVPKWLPLGQFFWGYLTGVFFIAAGLAILTGLQARLAAILLTVMIASFGLLANAPMLVANPYSHWNWTESILNFALTGAAWVVADSFGPNKALAL
jgi:uncharacterized membrane protein